MSQHVYDDVEGTPALLVARLERENKTLREALRIQQSLINEQRMADVMSCASWAAYRDARPKIDALLAEQPASAQQGAAVVSSPTCAKKNIVRGFCTSQYGHYGPCKFSMDAQQGGGE